MRSEGWLESFPILTIVLPPEGAEGMGEISSSISVIEYAPASCKTVDPEGTCHSRCNTALKGYRRRCSDTQIVSI